jgi:Zn-dependent metalloprotease
VRHSLLGTHLWYRQTYRGLPVLGGYLAKHLDPAGLVRQDDGRIAVPGTVPTTPIVSASAAGATVAARTVGVAEAPTLAILPGGPARLVWRVVSTTNAGSIETLVDATSGAVVRARSLVKNVDGTGQVFEPNPVVTLHDETLTDQKDAETMLARLDKQRSRSRVVQPLSRSGKYSGEWRQSHRHPRARECPRSRR